MAEKNGGRHGRNPAQTATSTGEADLEPTAEEWAKILERRRLRALAIAAGDDFEPSGRTQFLDSILSVAVDHDKVCQHYENVLYSALGFRDSQPVKDLDDAIVYDYTIKTTELCAIVVAAAELRVPGTDSFAEQLAITGTIGELSPDELEDFMRPIFEESGVGNRFEVRSGYQAFRAEGK